MKISKFFYEFVTWTCLWMITFTFFVRLNYMMNFITFYGEVSETRKDEQLTVV